MEKDIYFKAFSDALGEIKKHTEPSPETIKFISSATEQLKVLNKHFEEGGVIERIEKHVEHTNGEVANNSKWINRLAGGLSVIMVLIPIISSLFIYLINDIKKDMSQMITIEIERNNNKYFQIK